MSEMSEKLQPNLGGIGFFHWLIHAISSNMCNSSCSSCNWRNTIQSIYQGYWRMCLSIEYYGALTETDLSIFRKDFDEELRANFWNQLLTSSMHEHLPIIYHYGVLYGLFMLKLSNNGPKKQHFWVSSQFVIILLIVFLCYAQISIYY